MESQPQQVVTDMTAVTGGSNASAGAPPSRPSARGAGGKRTGPRGLRKWLFRLIAATVIPAAFIVLLELGLRLAGVGYETSFFVRQPGTGDRVSNQRFAWRFFPPTGARPPVPVRLAAAKPSRTVRIFIFGGSAAMGSPKPAFGFGRILEVMLAEDYGDLRFEVINCAMEAMNSHVARTIAQEAGSYDGDLFILYMGHNEVVGPYGVSDSFSGYTPSLGAVRASLWARSTRTGQVIRRVVRTLGGRSEGIWKGMETVVAGGVPADDGRLGVVRDHFRRNLLDILEEARSRGAGSILCSVALNLRDCAPFLPLHRAGLTEADKARWQALYDEAAASAASGDHAAAIEKLQAAAAIDDRFADLHYRLGHALLAAGRDAEAKASFLAAVELDGLRVRADEGMQQVIRQVSPRADAFVDARAAFERHPRSRGGLPGEELFLDHVHMNFEGNHALAAAVLPEVRRVLAGRGVLPAGAAAMTQPAPSVQRCRELLAHTGWDRYEMAQVILRQISRPPFTAQLDHAQRLAAWKAEVDRLRLFTAPEARAGTLQQYRAALERRPADLLLRNNHALCLYGFGDYAAAAEQWGDLLKRMPGNADLAKQFGDALLRQGRFDEAVGQFRAALDALPRDLDARNNLGMALLSEGKLEEAIACFGEVLKANSEHVGARTNLAIALDGKGQRQEAARQLQEALRMAPEDIQALRTYAVLLDKQNRPDEAASYYRKALAIREEATLHLDLGSLLAQRGRPDEAMAHYHRAVELEGDFAKARLVLGAALAARKEYPQALGHLEAAVRLDDRDPKAHYELGVVLQHLGRLPPATAHFAKAASLRPGDWAIRERLGYVLLLQGKFPEAAVQYKLVVAAQPGNPEARNNLATVLLRLGREDEAIAHLIVAVSLKPSPERCYNLARRLVGRLQDRDAVGHLRTALSLRPGWPEAMSEMAWVLATSEDAKVRNAGEAVRLARRACELTAHKRADMVDVLAAALAEAGQFAEAAATAETARQLAAASGDRHLADLIAKRIELYKAGKPCRRTAKEPDRAAAG